MKKTSLIIILCLALVFLTAAPALAAPDKDESIYVSLGYDGSVHLVQAVSRFTGISPDTPFTDYGALGDVVNLTAAGQPAIEDNQVTWDLGSEPPAEFYYQATLDKELPYSIDIRYFLDGSPVAGNALAGQSGHIRLEMDIRPNAGCDALLRENLMVQASISLDSEKCRSIQADGATLVVMGGFINLSYTVLPGEEASYTLAMDVDDFTMQGITFNLLSYENMLGDFQADLDGLTEGFDTMADSMQEMADGTQALQDGLSDMVGGLSDLDTGLSEFNGGTADFAAGMADFHNGLGALDRGLKDLSSGSGQIKSGLADIDGNGDPLLQGYIGIYQGLDALKTQSDGLISGGMITYLNDSGDPTLIGLAQYLSQENASLDSLATGMSGLNTGLTGYLDGISTLTGQYSAFHNGVAGLPRQVNAMLTGYADMQSGFTNLQSGLGELSGGLHTLYSGAQSMPGEVGSLVDGQIEFRDGIIDAKAESQERVDAFFPDDPAPPVSFVDERNTVRSVQYMLKTPDIEKTKDPAPHLEGNGDKQSFFQRLIALFR